MKAGATVLAVALSASLVLPALAHDRRARHEGAGERYSASEIRRARQKLDLGYPTGSADGVIGRKTHTALKNFQRDKSLNATGDLNDETPSALDVREGSSTAASSR